LNVTEAMNMKLNVKTLAIFMKLEYFILTIMGISDTFKSHTKFSMYMSDIVKKFSLIILICLIISVNCALAESGATVKLNQNDTSPSYFTNIVFTLHSLSNNPIKGATIFITPNLSVPTSNWMTNKETYLITDQIGSSIVKLGYGTYDFSINAKGYDIENKTITISKESPQNFEFTLIPDTDIWIFFLPIYLGFLIYVCWLCGSSEKMKLVFILFLLAILVPFLCLMSDWSHTMFFYVSLFFSFLLLIIFMLLYLYSIKKLPFAQKWEDCSNIISKVFGTTQALLTILTILSWPLIACYFACENIESVVISFLNYLEFPSFIVIGVTIGVLSYLMLTVKQTFNQLLPLHKKKSVVWECTRRIIIAPYIAVMGIYLILYGGTPINTQHEAHFVFLFSIFAGMFTGTIEEWIYNKVKDVLSLNKEEQFENSKYDIENSSLTKLGMSEDMAYWLYYEANIADQQELANSDANILLGKLKSKYTENEIKYYIDLAKAAKT
jgi:hypothetical protein